MCGLQLGGHAAKAICGDSSWDIVLHKKGGRQVQAAGWLVAGRTCCMYGGGEYTGGLADVGEESAHMSAYGARVSG